MLVFVGTLGLRNDNKTVLWVCAIRVIFEFVLRCAWNVRGCCVVDA